MSTISKNLGLILTSISDTSKKFLDYRNELSGESGSNMTKIDDAFGPVQEHIINKENPHGVSLEQIGAEKAGTANTLISEHNVSEDAHANIVQKIPTKVSQLTNDSNYLTEESDPTVPGWAKQPTKPTYTAVEVGASTPPKIIPIILEQSLWSDKTQTVSVNGISATEGNQLIQPVPFIQDQAEYIDKVIICTNQAENSLTFSCDEVPTKNLNIYIIIQEVAT